LLVTGLVACLACAGGLRLPSAASQREAYADAVALEATDPAAGAAALQAFIDDYPTSPLADDAAYRLARGELEAGQPTAARAHLKWLLSHHPRGDQADRAGLMLARIQYDEGEYAASARNASKLRLSQLPDAQRREATRLLADLAAVSGDSTAQLRWLAQLRADPGPGVSEAEIDAEMETVIDSLDDAGLAAAAEQLGRRVPAARVRLVEAERAMDAGNRDAAERALDRARRLPGSEADGRKLAALEARLAGGEVGPGPAPLSTGSVLLGLPAPELGPAQPPTPGRGTVGAVLPLSGPYAAFGEESLQGLLLAARLVDSGDGGARGGGLRVLVRDSGGEPDRAAAAVQELAADPNVAAIFGPLLANESEAAAEAAEAAEVPLLTFSRRESVGDGRPHVVTPAASPRLEGELLAAYSIQVLGIRTFAILHPRNAFGDALRTSFAAAVEKLGAQVVGIASYAPDAVDFAGPIRSLLGYDAIGPGTKAALAKREKLRKRAKRLPGEQAAELRREANALRAPGGGPLPPYVNFDALFIPDTYEMASLIAPHLAFHEVRGVRLLGTSAWNNPGLVRIGGRHVNGAVFTGGYLQDSGLERVDDFGTRYVGAFGKKPDYLGAQAYDAMAWMLDVLAGRAAERRTLLKRLDGSPPYQGASGVLARPSERFVKRPLLLGVESGRIISIDARGAPPTLSGDRALRRMEAAYGAPSEGPGADQAAPVEP
jgi:ABC-type branched-subunit amino acid transport system substrate-binding protein/predicted negative regulator of RcsB-dependent stress response